MEHPYNLGREASIFGNIFLLANRLQVIIDRDFARYSITAKQWFLMAVVGSIFKEPPTIKEVSNFMHSSHQNVKQLALKLKKNGYMKLFKDESDKRVTRLMLIEKCDYLWAQRKEEDVAFFKELFNSFSQSEIDSLYSSLNRLSDNLTKISKD